jgi:CRP-like cAMP-binding protein
VSYTLLKNFTDKIQPLKEEEWVDFEAIWQLFSYKRKTLLTTVGETEKYLYFVLEGVQRGYALSPEGEEVTIIFTYPYSFSGVADSLVTETPSSYFFETLTPSRLLRTSYQQLKVCMEQHTGVHQMIYKAVSWALKGALERQVELQCLSSEQKFRKLLSRSPQVLNLIPHKYLASYMGMDPTTFSKLLSSVRID